MNAELQREEEATFTEDDTSQVPPSEIVAYNELRSCADLFRMHNQKILDIHPEFQRNVVWKPADQTRFIDSLVKQLPIPSMCFALDYKAQKWIVIDGLQRISTIVKFLAGGDWRLSKTDDIDPGLAGRSVAAIKMIDSSLHHYYTRVENLSIPVTVLRCDFQKASHMDYLFTIFHRLNTGGMKLNNQEIRNCIYGGALNTLLKELDKYPSWRKMNKMAKGNSYRFIKQEVILRFLAFHDNYNNYNGQLAKFLNDYMRKHQNEKDEWILKKTELFKQTVDYVSDNLINSGSKVIPTTILESVLVGVGTGFRNGNLAPQAEAKSCFKNLISHPVFSEEARKEGLSKKPRVIERMKTAINIFAVEG